jgi:hypothetical protein
MSRLAMTCCKRCGWMVKSMQPSAGPSKVFNRAEIDERKCQQQMKVFDGLDASTPGMMRQLCIDDQNL